MSPATRRTLILVLALCLAPPIRAGDAEPDLAAETAMAAQELPRRVALDTAVSSADATDQAGRDDFWRTFGLLLQGIGKTEDGKGMRLEFGPNDRFKIGLTLRDPALSDAAAQALTADEQTKALRGLSATDDATIDFKLRLGREAPGRLAGLLATSARAAIDEAIRADVEAARAHDASPWRAVWFQQSAVAKRRAISGKTRDQAGNATVDPSALGPLRAAKALLVAVLQQELAQSPSVPADKIRARFSVSDCSSFKKLFVPSERFTDHGEEATCDAVLRIDRDATAARQSPFTAADEEQLVSERDALDEKVSVAEAQADELVEQANKLGGVDDADADRSSPALEGVLELMRLAFIAEKNRFAGAVTLTHHVADPLISPDETELAANFRWGFPHLPGDQKRAEVALEDLVRDKGPLRHHAHSFSAQLGWKKIQDSAVRDHPSLNVLGHSETSLSFNWATKVASKQLTAHGLPAGADSSFTLTYHDASGDEANDRFVLNETLTFHINDKLALPLSFTYANESEYVKEDDVRGHFGFSYTFPDKKETQAKAE